MAYEVKTKMQAISTMMIDSEKVHCIKTNDKLVNDKLREFLLSHPMEVIPTVFKLWRYTFNLFTMFFVKIHYAPTVRCQACQSLSGKVKCKPMVLHLTLQGIYLTKQGERTPYSVKPTSTFTRNVMHIKILIFHL